MIVFVPPGDPLDPTRSPAFYDSSYQLLREMGLPEIG
jgi:hypothetical protein